MPNDMEKNAVQESIAGFADQLVRAEMRSGLKRPDAERAIARRIGVAPSSLETLRRGRLKNVDGIGTKIRKALISEFERQIQTLEHKLAVARAMDRPIDFDAVETLLGMAKEKLNGEIETGDQQ